MVDFELLCLQKRPREDTTADLRYVEFEEGEKISNDLFSLSMIGCTKSSGTEKCNYWKDASDYSLGKTL